MAMSPKKDMDGPDGLPSGKANSSGKGGGSKLAKALGGLSDSPPKSTDDIGDDSNDGYISREGVSAYQDYANLHKSGDSKGAAMALKAFIQEHC